MRLTCEVGRLQGTLFVSSSFFFPSAKGFIVSICSTAGSKAPGSLKSCLVAAGRDSGGSLDTGDAKGPPPLPRQRLLGSRGSGAWGWALDEILVQPSLGAGWGASLRGAVRWLPSSWWASPPHLRSCSVTVCKFTFMVHSWCTVRSMKLKHQSLEQRNVYCRAL